MDAERLQKAIGETSEVSSGLSHRSSESLLGLRSKDRPVDDNSYPTVWLMTDEEYQQLQEGREGGE